MADTTLTLYRLNDNYIKITGLKNAVTNDYDNSAVLTANLYDKNSALVDGATAIPLDYVPSSNGDYIGFITGTTFDAPKGSGYLLRITSLGVFLTVQRKVVVAERTS